MSGTDTRPLSSQLCSKARPAPPSSTLEPGCTSSFEARRVASPAAAIRQCEVADTLRGVRGIRRNDRLGLPPPPTRCAIDASASRKTDIPITVCRPWDRQACRTARAWRTPRSHTVNAGGSGVTVAHLNSVKGLTTGGNCEAKARRGSRQALRMIACGCQRSQINILDAVPIRACRAARGTSSSSTRRTTRARR